MTAESQSVIQRLGLVSTKEAAKYLGLELENFYRSASKEIKPRGTFKKVNYYHTDDLDKWITSHFELDSAKVKEVSENQN